ncbi:flagellar hook-associated protein FlgK [Evansella sp. AB-P1]|uniref:flagellar hook-associated protein FlgK n=1 Tax=Evansella sp. AB-P1 TaxID=3037653 RepID=UPI00241EC876|nr:flagellar hook-associated protein FlgK [Evansella sp. AB-P1]MDG5786675.1 flagellar hook-associated protein FlgK [Evansella sp. AB-P1]
MTSTFHGLETARRALGTNQTAIQTTGHNIANANTPGYSRQRVNFAPTEAYPAPSFNKPGVAGQIGSGVKPGEVQRIRESFLDVQYRSENNKFGFWDGISKAWTKIEDIMNEPTENGIASSMDRFWRSLQDLSVHPEDSGARSVVLQQGTALAETFNYTYDSLEATQKDYKKQIEVQEKHINSLLDQINKINKQIAGVEPHGFLTNDLYDQRDLLVDELSLYLNVSVEQVGSGGLSSDVASGRYTVKLLDDYGRETGVTLVDGSRLEHHSLKVFFDDSDSGLVEEIYVATSKELALINDDKLEWEDLRGKGNPLDEFPSMGQFTATIEAFGYIDSEGREKGLLPEMLRDLDEMVFTFVEEFNKVHQSGWSLYEINEKAVDPNYEKEGFNFFSYKDGPTPIDENNKGTAARRLQVNNELITDLDKIAASAAAEKEDGEYIPKEIAFTGDGSNALALANVKDANLSFAGSTTNVQSFYQGVIGNMAVNGSEAERMTKNSETLRESVENRRQSVSGVSLDEEMADLIKFQHAYNAAARSLTVMDEMLDRIINGMGIVGR